MNKPTKLMLYRSNDGTVQLEVPLDLNAILSAGCRTAMRNNLIAGK